MAPVNLFMEAPDSALSSGRQDEYSKLCGLATAPTTVAGQELVEAAKAVVATHEDTAGIDFVGWCQMLSAKVDALRAALSSTDGRAS